MEVVRWLTTVMFGLTIGLACLAVPTFFIAFGSPTDKQKPQETQPQTHYEYHIDESQHCQPCPTIEKPVVKQLPPHQGSPNPKKMPCQPCSLHENPTPKVAPESDSKPKKEI